MTSYNDYFWGPEDNSIPSPCKYGEIIPGHACYCYHEDENAPRKCPIWKWDDEWNVSNCNLFEAKENHEN